MKTRTRTSGGPPEPSRRQLELGKRMEEIMRIRRTLIGPAILTIATVGSIVAGPVLALTAAATPAAPAVASGTTPDLNFMH